MKAIFAIFSFAIVLFLTGCGGGGGSAKDIQPPVISNAQVSPVLITSGGTIHGSAKITDNIGVSSAKLMIEGTAFESDMSLSGTNTYAGDLILPAAMTDGVYLVKIEARDAAGNVMVSAVSNITVEGPPQPPPGNTSK